MRLHLTFEAIVAHELLWKLHDKQLILKTIFNIIMFLTWFWGLDNDILLKTTNKSKNYYLSKQISPPTTVTTFFCCLE